VSSEQFDDDDSTKSIYSDHMSTSQSAFPNPHNAIVGQRSSLHPDFETTGLHHGIPPVHKVRTTKVGSKPSPYASSSSSGSLTTTQSGQDIDMEAFRAWQAMKKAEANLYVDLSGEEKISNLPTDQRPTPPNPTARLLIQGAVVPTKRKRKYRQIHPGTI
jgi:hypothetical protein